MKQLSSWLGGSHIYGLNTPSSDEDVRGVFLHEDVDAIIGLTRFDQETKNNKTEDSQHYELRHFLQMLSKGTLNMLEPLWNTQTTTLSTPEWEALVKNRAEFFPTELIGKKLFGFLNSQFQDTFDDLKKSDETSIRGQNIRKYGYHPKSAMHTIRLAETGAYLFLTGIYRIKPFTYHEVCMDLKTRPEKFKPGQVRRLMTNAQEVFEHARSNTKIEMRTFNRELANEIILSSYGPIIADRFGELTER